MPDIVQAHPWPGQLGSSRACPYPVASRKRMNSELLAIIRCPETRQTLAVADAALIVWLNAQVAAGALRNTAGRQITTQFDAGLVRADGRVVYPVCNGVPVLRVDEAILLR